MPRVKRGVIHLKKRRNLLKKAKGYRWGRKKNIKVARIAVIKAGVHAYKDRKRKKREFRQLHTIKLNAGLRENGVSYSRFIGAQKKKGIELDRKVLSILAERYPEVLKQVVTAVK